MFVVRRIATEYSLRGVPGVLNLIGSRIARRRSDLLFIRELNVAELDSSTSDTLPIVVVDRTNAGTAQTQSVEQQILHGDNEQYRDGLSDLDSMYAGLDDKGRVITYAFVLFRTQYKRILGISDDIPLISNCFTFEEYRGKRLYPRMLQHICRELARAGYANAAISCAPDNTASISGIERAGFKGVAHLQCVNLLSRLIFNRRIEDYAAWRALNRAVPARKVS